MPHVPTNILIFVIIELLDAKTEKSMHPIKLYIYIYRLRHVPYLILKFLSNELLGAKINEYKFNHILNWILCKYSILCCVLYNFLIFVTSELLGAKTKESKF